MCEAGTDWSDLGADEDVLWTNYATQIEDNRKPRRMTEISGRCEVRREQGERELNLSSG
jgi:hypothetical protein